MSKNSGVFQAIIEGSQDPVLTLDSAGRVIVLNQAGRAVYERLYGVELKVGEPLPSATPHRPGEWATTLERWGRALKGETVSKALEFDDAEGAREAWEFGFTPLRDRQGRLTGAVQTGHNVSERTDELARANEALQREVAERRRAEQALGSVALFPEQNPSPVMRVTAEGELTYANAPGRRLLDELGWWPGRPVPEPLAGAAREALNTNEIKELELDCADRVFAFMLAPVVSGHYINLYGKDISRRRQALEELARQREWLRVTLSSIGDAVLTSDAEGRVTFLNPVAEALSGWKVAEALGRPIQQVFRIFNEQTGEPAEDIVGRVLRERHVVELANHTALMTRDGRMVPIEDSAAPIVDGAGNLAGVVLVFHDVTEKRRAQQALRESEQQVRRKLESILEPEGDIGGLELADIIDAGAIQSLMEDFYRLARIPMSIVDLKGRVLVGVGWQEICMKFHRVHPETRRHCIQSDLELSAGLAAGESRLYRCKNNMWDIATPILVGGHHLGNILSGQFFFEDEPLDREAFRAQARRYGFDEPDYLAALEAVPRISRASADTGMEFFKKLAQMLSSLSYSNIKLARSLAARESLMESLRRSEYRLNRAQEIAHLGSWELDVTANRLTWSDEVYRIFGLQPQGFAATYEAFLEAVHPEDRAAVDAAYASSLCEARGEYEIEHRIVRQPGGEVRWVQEKCEHVKDENGRIIRSQGMVLDITERKQREEQLRKLNRTMRASSNSNQTLIYATKEETLLAEVCRIVVQDCGHTMAWIGYAETDDARSVRPVAQWGFDDGYLEQARITWADSERGRGPTGTAIRTGQPVVCNNMLTDPRFAPWRTEAIRRGYASSIALPLKAEGRTFGTLTIYSREEAPFSADEVSLLTELASDLSYGIGAIRVREAHAQGEAELLLRNERLELLSNAAAHLLRAENPETMVRELFEKVCRHLDVHAYFNFMVNEAGDALRLDSCAGIPDRAAALIQRLEFGQAICGTVAETRQPMHVKDVQHSPDEKVRLIKSYGIRAYCCHPLLAGERLLGTLSFGTRAKDRYTDDEVAFMRTICHYVAIAKERLRMERELRRHIEQLAEADQRKDEFLAMLAHELRNPLAPVRNATQILRLIGSKDAAAVRQQEIIERQIRHMARLLDDLLDVSRITRGKIELNLEPLLLIDVLVHAVETASPLIDKKNHTLNVAMPAAGLRVRGDGDRLAQVVGNLLTNAAKYTDEGGEIWLEAGQEDGQARIRVRDNGAGIPAEMLPRVFDLFIQADRTLDRSQGGLGIGLTLVRSLVQMHGGMVEAHSGGPGKGSEFIVRLPALEEERQVMDNQCPRPEEAPAPARRRILVVDDVRDSADSLADYLRLMGHEVRTAYHGLAALESSQTFTPEVVLLDIGLPGINGYEVARRLRQEFADRPLLIVAMTGYGQDSDRRMALESGFDEHLLKPVDLEAVLRLMAELPQTP